MECENQNHLWQMVIRLSSTAFGLTSFGASPVVRERWTGGNAGCWRDSSPAAVILALMLCTVKSLCALKMPFWFKTTLHVAEHLRADCLKDLV